VAQPFTLRKSAGGSTLRGGDTLRGRERPLPVITVIITLVSGRLTNITKGATLSIVALSGQLRIVRMALVFAIQLFSGITTVITKKDTEDIDITLASGKADITKESKD